MPSAPTPEATGIYWSEFELVLANAGHVKNVPGRKTDVNDAMWLAELLAHGLIRASFVPNAQTQEMRNLLLRASNWFVSSRATCCAYDEVSRTGSLYVRPLFCL